MSTQVQAHQLAGPRVPDGSAANALGSRYGHLFTASWKEWLAMSGNAWRVTVGTITGGGDVAPVTGGGNGTTVDQDQPEIAIGVDAGYYMIPLEIDISCHVDMDADGEDGDIIVAVDRSAAVPSSVTGTTETPTNLRDGSEAFPGRAFSAITGDITDPTVDEILASRHIQGSDNGTAGNLAVVKLDLHYVAEVPTIIAGPCGLYVYWGGVAAVGGVASVVVAALPDAAFG